MHRPSLAVLGTNLRGPVAGPIQRLAMHLRRSAARLQAGFRRSIGGLQRQATDRLIDSVLGSKSSSEFPFVYGS